MVGGIGFFAAWPVPQIDGVEDRLLVHRHVDGAADADVVERLLQDVEGQVAGVQPRLADHRHRRVLLHRRQVGRVRRRDHLALIGLQLGVADRGIGGDGEDQRVDLLPPAPGLVEGLVADHRVRQVLDEAERPGADRDLVDILRRAGLHHRIGIFRRQDLGEVHRHVGDERRLRLGQGEADRSVVDLVDRLQQRRHAHVAEVVVRTAGDLVIGAVVLPHPVEREQHVVGIEVPRRREGLVGMPLHALAQMEGVDGAVVGHVPGFGQGRHHLGAAALERHQPVIDRHRGVQAGAGGVDLRVEVLRAAFGAVDQRLGLG